MGGEKFTSNIIHAYFNAPSIIDFDGVTLSTGQRTALHIAPISTFTTKGVSGPRFDRHLESYAWEKERRVFFQSATKKANTSLLCRHSNLCSTTYSKVYRFLNKVYDRVLIGIHPRYLDWLQAALYGLRPDAIALLDSYGNPGANLRSSLSATKNIFTCSIGTAETIRASVGFKYNRELVVFNNSVYSNEVWKFRWPCGNISWFVQA